MEDLLLKEIDKIKTSAKKVGVVFDYIFIAEGLALLYNKLSGKAAVLGLTAEFLKIKSMDVIMIRPKAYKVNLKQWTWFLNEGFRSKDIAGKLFDQVFEEECAYSIIDMLRDEKKS